MHLNGWQRIGAVLSIAWLIVVGAYWWIHRLDSVDALYTFKSTLCEVASDTTAEKDKCQQAALAESRSIASDEINQTWPQALIFYVVTLIGFWFVVWVLFEIGRWVRRGFSSN